MTLTGVTLTRAWPDPRCGPRKRGSRPKAHPASLRPPLLPRAQVGLPPGTCPWPCQSSGSPVEEIFALGMTQHTQSGFLPSRSLEIPSHEGRRVPAVGENSRSVRPSECRCLGSTFVQHRGEPSSTVGAAGLIQDPQDGGHRLHPSQSTGLQDGPQPPPALA